MLRPCVLKKLSCVGAEVVHEKIYEHTNNIYTHTLNEYTRSMAFQHFACQISNFVVPHQLYQVSIIMWHVAFLLHKWIQLASMCMGLFSKNKILNKTKQIHHSRVPTPLHPKNANMSPNQPLLCLELIPFVFCGPTSLALWMKWLE